MRRIRGRKKIRFIPFRTAYQRRCWVECGWDWYAKASNPAPSVYGGVLGGDRFSPYRPSVGCRTAVNRRCWVDCFQFALLNSYENSNGTIDFSAGSLMNFPSGTFDVFVVEFEVIAPTASTALAFHTEMPRETDVTSGGASVLDGHLDGEVELLTPPVPPGSFNVTPQGDGMLLTWTTGSEEGLDGFNLYRSPILDSGRALDVQRLEKLNDELIGLEGAGTLYEFSDGTGDSSYDYWLEYAMLDGSTAMHPEAASDSTPTSITLDALSSTPRTNYWLWALLPIGLTMLAGALMRL